MVIFSVMRFRVPVSRVLRNGGAVRKFNSIFGLDDLLTPEKVCAILKPASDRPFTYLAWLDKFSEQPTQLPSFTLKPVAVEQHDLALELIKRHYLPEHVLVRDRNMDLMDDRAIDDYLIRLIKQGNTILAKSDSGTPAGVCVGFASSPVDARNLRSFAFYRQVCIPSRRGDCAQYSKLDAPQDQNVKDFLYFSAKLLETPNLWETFRAEKIFEIKMLTVVPEFRRQGLGTQLVEACKSQANDQGYNVVRMDCINPYDYKVAERCMLHCIAKFPLHKLRGPNAPFVKSSSPNNCRVQVYVDSRPQPDTPDLKTVKQRRHELESLIE